MSRLTWAALAAALLAAAGTGVARADYAFDFYCRGDTVAQVDPGLQADFALTLANTGSSGDVYAFECRRLQAPADWEVVYCLGGLCAEPGITLYDSLAAGAQDTAVTLHVYTSATAGEAVVVLHVASQGNPALADSVTFHVRAGVGVLEQRDARATSRQFLAPNPVRRGGTLRLSGPGRVELYDGGGRLAAEGYAAGGSWVVPAGLAPGVYAVRQPGRRGGCSLVIR